MSGTPQEILPGVFHWRAKHPSIGAEVDSYWVEDDGVLIDPLVPAEGGLEWFDTRAQRPRTIVLSNRHHYRESDRFAERFGIGAVRVPRAGMHEFGGRRLAEPYDPGDKLPGGLVVHEIGAICPDDMALHLPSKQAVVFADGIVLGGSGEAKGLPGFVPDKLMDDPEETKRGLLAAVSRLLDTADFRHVLCAHGGPLLHSGRQRLEELVQIGGRTAFEM